MLKWGHWEPRVQCHATQQKDAGSIEKTGSNIAKCLSGSSSHTSKPIFVAVMGKQFDQWQGITSVHKVQWWHNVPGQSLLCIQKSTHNVIVDEVSVDLQASEPPVQFKHSKPCDRGQNLQLVMINNLWSSRELIKRLNSSVLSRSFHPTCGCVRDFEHSVYFCNTVVPATKRKTIISKTEWRLTGWRT